MAEVQASQPSIYNLQPTTSLLFGAASVQSTTITSLAFPLHSPATSHVSLEKVPNMSTAFWSQDYSQQSVYQGQCNTANTSNNSNHQYPTSPMEDRNYNQSFTSPGVTPPRGSPPTSPANLGDSFGQMILHDTTVQYAGAMQPTYNQQYTNYQVHSPAAQPMVVSPDFKGAYPTMPSQQQMNPFDTAIMSPPISPLWTPASPTASPPQAGPTIPIANPFDMFAPSMPTQQAPLMPNQAPPPVPTACQPNNAHVVANTTNANSQNDDDAAFWADMGFGVAPPSGNNDASSTASSTSTSSNSPAFNHSTNNNAPIELDSNSLPAGGEYYKARVTTPLIGAIFSSGSELRTTLFSTASSQFVELVGARPVVSFTIDGGAADTAGIAPGHILLSVNSTPVNDTDAAVKLVASAPRPLVMEYYIPPNVKVIKTEGQCMVKYDTVGTEAPSSSLEWKGKYVVVGDMLGKPNVIYMYRSKAEYDIAVKEAQRPSRKLSVKVKQFDLSGARIFHENAHVSYPNQRSSWYYFTIVRPVGMPIKISCTSREELRPIYEGVVAFLEEEKQMDERFEERRIHGGGARGGGETFY